MKQILKIYGLIIALALGSCIKNDPVVFKGSQAEFDAATWNAKAPGLTYPILNRVPAVGTNTTNSSPSLTRTSGSFTLRVNLVGAQKDTDTPFSYRVVTAESTAIAGTHFQALSGTGTIPANSSFGTITVNVLDPGSSVDPVTLVLELTDSGDLKANTNYAKVGLSIAQN